MAGTPFALCSWRTTNQETRMKTFAFFAILALFAGTAAVHAQNMIVNPGFENGTIPTDGDQLALATGWSRNCGRNWDTSRPDGNQGSPDLFDIRSPNCLFGIPSNKWGNRNVRNGGNRYVGFTGTSTLHPGFFGETVEGTLSSPLGSACSYQVSFWASATDGVKAGTAGATPCNTPLTPFVPDPNANQMQVVLRKDNDCSNGKIVYTSPSITQKNWTYFSGQFYLSAADAAAGYNRIEFRLAPANPTFGKYSNTVYLDDVGLQVASGPPIDPDFKLTGWIPQGNPSTFLAQADVATVPQGSGFWWNVEEIDPATGATVPNTTMTNPPAWWNTPNSTQFPGYYQNNSPYGVFLQGRTYRIRRGTWSQCSPWTEISKTISLCSGPHCP
jgi:hypothetical protein